MPQSCDHSSHSILCNIHKLSFDVAFFLWPLSPIEENISYVETQKTYMCFHYILHFVLFFILIWSSYYHHMFLYWYFFLHFAISFNLVLFTWLFLVSLLSVSVLSFMCALSLNLCIFCVSWFALFILITFFEFLFMSIHYYVCTYVLHLVVMLHVLCCCVICAMCVTSRFDDTPLKAWHKVLG
jgi:hypothetical protein